MDDIHSGEVVYVIPEGSAKDSDNYTKGISGENINMKDSGEEDGFDTHVEIALQHGSQWWTTLLL